MPTFGDKFLTNFQASKAEATRRAAEAKIHNLRIQQLGEQIRSNKAAEADRDATRQLGRDQLDASTIDGKTVGVRQFEDTVNRRQTYVDPDTGEEYEVAPEFAITAGQQEDRIDIAEGNLGVQEYLADLAGDRFDFSKKQYQDEQQLAAIQRQRFRNYIGKLQETMRQPHPVAEAVENAEELNFGEKIFDHTIGPLIRPFGLEGVGIGAKKDRNRARIERAEQQLRDRDASLLGAALLARINSPLGLGTIQAQGAAGAAGVGASAQALPDVPLRSRGLLGLGPNDAYGDILRQLEQLRYTGVGAFQNQSTGQ